jgi:hypothetical protein
MIRKISFAGFQILHLAASVERERTVGTERYSDPEREAILERLSASGAVAEFFRFVDVVRTLRAQDDPAPTDEEEAGARSDMRSIRGAKK